MMNLLHLGGVGVLLRFIARRIILIIVSMFVIITTTFFLMRNAPGGPFTSPKSLNPEILENLRSYYGLGNPWYVQLWDYLSSIATWDFGYSMKYQGQTVNDIISTHFPISAILGLEAILVAVVFGILFGCIAALRQNKFADRSAMVLAVVGISVPNFVLAAVLQYFFASQLGWFPIARFESFSATILPTIALAALPLAFIARLMRSNMIEELNADYIRTAKAKGVSQRVAVYKHAIRNAIMPVVSYMGPLIAAILTGSFVVEKIFGIPGLGQTFVTSITNRDYSLIMGITVFYSLILLVSILILDLLYKVIDPRIKFDGGDD